MENDGDVVIIGDDETYEVKAIKDYLAKEISAKDLAHSLGVTRSYAYKRVQRYVEGGGMRRKSMARQRRSTIAGSGGTTRASLFA